MDSRTPDVNDDSARLSVDPGEQVLVTADRPLLEYLPDEAFENLLVLTTTALPSRVDRQVRERGHDSSRVGVIPVTGGDVDYEGPLWVADRVGPADLTGLSMRFSTAFEHVRSGIGWVCVDSVSTLYMYAEERRVFRLLQSIAEACRRRDVRGLYRAVPNTLGEQTRGALNGVVDRSVTLE